MGPVDSQAEALVKLVAPLSVWVCRCLSRTYPEPFSKRPLLPRASELWTRIEWPSPACLFPKSHFLHSLLATRFSSPHPKFTLNLKGGGERERPAMKKGNQGVQPSQGADASLNLFPPNAGRGGQRKEQAIGCNSQALLLCNNSLIAGGGSWFDFATLSSPPRQGKRKAPERVGLIARTLIAPRSRRPHAFH